MCASKWKPQIMVHFQTSVIINVTVDSVTMRNDKNIITVEKLITVLENKHKIFQFNVLYM